MISKNKTDVIREFKNLDKAQQLEILQRGIGKNNADYLSILVVLLPVVNGRSREALIETLSSTGDLLVIERLLEYLYDEDSRVRNDAVEIISAIGTPALPIITPLTNDKDNDVRKFAIQILGKIGDSQSVPRLIPLLDENDVNVRTSAIESLGRIGDPRGVVPIIRIIEKDKNPWVKIFAIEALSHIDDPQVISVLHKALNDEDPPVLLAVLKNLAIVGDDISVGILIERLGRGPAPIDSYVIYALGRIIRRLQLEFDDESIALLQNKISFILTSLEDKDQEISEMAAYVLSMTGPDDSIDTIIRFAMAREEVPEIIQEVFENPGGKCVRSILNQFNPHTCKNPCYFISVLGMSGSLLAIPFLQDLLDSDNEELRLEALNALINIGDRSITDRVITLLHDPLGHIRRASAKALGDMNCKNSVNDLMALLHDRYEDVRFEAAKALVKIGGKQVLDNLASLLRDESENTRTAAAFSMAQAYLPPEYHDDITNALFDSSWQVRKFAVEALSKMTEPLSMENLVPILQDENNEVRMKAINVICKVSLPGLLDYLPPLLQDADVWVRYETAKGIRNIKDPRSVKALIDCLNVEVSSIVQVAALESLHEIGGSEALGAIRKMADSQDFEVQNTARLILDSLEERGE